MGWIGAATLGIALEEPARAERLRIAVGRQGVDPARFAGLPALMADGVAFESLSAPLSPQQIEQIVQIRKAVP